MALWNKVKQGIDKAGKAAQDVFDEGKLRLDAYRAREQADKAAEALGYAVFRAVDAGGELAADVRERLLMTLGALEADARRLEAELAAARTMHAAGEPAPAPATSPTAPATAAATAAAADPRS